LASAVCVSQEYSFSETGKYKYEGGKRKSYLQNDFRGSGTKMKRKTLRIIASIVNTPQAGRFGIGIRFLVVTEYFLRSTAPISTLVPKWVEQPGYEVDHTFQTVPRRRVSHPRNRPYRPVGL
jgi:hypothetical protein